METRRTTHPTADVLKAFGLGKLDDSSSGALMAHLDLCANCRKIVASQSGDDFLDRLRQAHGRSATPAPPKSLADAAPRPQPPLKPTTLFNVPPELADNPQYEIIQEIGQGGMGVVYLAKNKLMDRLEVLKVINKALLDRAGAVERFLREIRSAARLNHVNVVAAYSALQLGDLLVFAMEYVEGQDLAAVVKANGPLPVAHACFYVQQAAQGLQHAFEKKMVHRDIKPQNLILAREGRKHLVKVLDFGLAKVMREKSDDTGLTGEGKMLGTPDYMAPEQTLDATSADIRADIYSLGCTLYFLLSGQRPFKGKNLYDIMQAHQSLEAPALNLARPEVPAELAAVVRKMMAKDRAQRYQTPLDVVQALGPFLRQGAKPKSPSVPVVKAESPSVPSTSAKPPPLPATPPPVAWDSLTDSVLASAQSGKSEVIRIRPSGAAQSGSRKGWLLGGTLAVGLLMLGWLGYWLAAVLFRVETPNGTLLVEINDENVEARITNSKLILSGPDGKVRYTLSPHDRRKQLEAGTYKIRVEGADGLVLDTPEFTIKKGGEVKVRVRLDKRKVAKKEPLGKPNVPKTVTIDLGGGVKMEFVLIPKGKFKMGSPKDEQYRNRWERAFDAESQHEVEITSSFYLAKYPVTQEQYAAITGKQPSYFSAVGGGKDKVAGLNTARFPVEEVSWYDARKCCAELTKRDRRGRRFRLPTEAEWEYACRAGTRTAYFFGEDHQRLGDYAWFRDNAGNRPHPVGEKRPNPWGLDDMHGNVWQWCEDYYGPYEGLTAQDPLRKDKHSEESRILRGGSWNNDPGNCRAASRHRWAPESGHSFRIALDWSGEDRKNEGESTETTGLDP